MGSNPKVFKKSILASSVAACLVTSTNTSAQEREVEEVIVTGMRAATEKAIAIKRNTAGVVDAISAEDIGKMPDTNLAESLQRITGVSISRQNGEGSEITVRGLGPDYNLITLNGRQMPAASFSVGANGASTGSSASRSFDFSTIASESVTGIQVYKTGRADVASGGMGATVNITTARPFENPGLSFSVGGKAVMDTTNEVNSDLTPEVVGIFSWTDPNEMFGVGLNVSYQERDSSQAFAYVTQWNTSTFGDAGSFASGVTYSGDIPGEDDLVSLPSDIRYSVYDEERARTNGQLVLQFAPSDLIEMTLDYVYSKNEVEAERHEQSMWFDQSFTEVEWSVSPEGVYTPTRLREERGAGGGKDYAFSNQARHRITENDSIGFNLDWSVTENLTLTFDAHNSTAEARPGAEWGNWANVSMGAPVGSSTEVFFNDSLPHMLIGIDDSTGNDNGEFDRGDIGSQVARAAGGWQKQEVTQIRIDGELSWDEGAITFGVESRNQEASNRNTGESTDVMGDWAITDVDAFPDELLSTRNIIGQFDDFDSGQTPTTAFVGNAIEIANWGANQYAGTGNGGWLNGNEFTMLRTFATNQVTEEEVLAAYFTVSLNTELGGMPVNVLAGVRYEQTDVTSNAIENVPTSISWTDNQDFVFNRSSDIQTSSAENGYEHILPNFDMDIGITDEIKARFSYSKTIARPTFDRLDLAASELAISAPTPQTGLPVATANRGNPSLVPIESDNLDLSFEWYFGESSMASIGYFEKHITNFIGQGTFIDDLNSVRDATSGPRVDAARQALLDLDPNAQLSANEVFAQVVIMENNLTGFDPFDVADQTALGAQYDVEAVDADPEYQFLYSGPVNANDGIIEGFELAGQHFFGDTGFGIMANLTFANSNTGYDRAGDPGTSQFAIVGLSNTRNLVFMYENFGVQARLAYNWRDEFLENQAIQANEPRFVEEYEQWDVSVSYDITDSIQVLFEGINITGEDARSHGRTPLQLVNLEELGPRYAIGARYSF